MDHQRFDLLARVVSSCSSRRQALRFLIAGTLLGLGADRVLAAQEATPSAACPDGLTYCADSGECVDLQTDLANCGACGSICESGLVGVECRSGECVRASCPEGIDYCGAVDGCRNLTVDPEHCGACGNDCASGVCIESLCSPDASDCEAGQTNCGGACVDTCCDNDNCGACGIACPTGSTCFEGVCDCPSGLCCAEGESLCGDACVATCCDNNNCGACGNVCTDGETCFEGQCGCPSGLCGPTTPPGTGVGGGPATTWVAMAGASVVSAMVAYWRRAGGGLMSGDE